MTDWRGDLNDDCTLERYPHWMALPKYLRDKIWRAFRPGQEITKTPSREYVEVAREVQEWIAKHQQE